MNKLSARNMTLFVVAMYVAVGLLLYSDVILNGAFLFDDFEYIVGNDVIHDPLSVLLDLTDTRQIGYLSFALNYAVGGEYPLGFHLVNVVIHIINAVLVFYLAGILLNILSGEKSAPDNRYHAAAFLSGLIFLVHPLQTQAVSYVTQRFTSLVSMFYLLSVVMYLAARVRFEKGLPGGRTYAVYGISILSALLAMKTKEIAFTIPFATGILELLVFKCSKYGKRRFYFLIPHAATVVLIPLSIFGPEWGLIGAGQGVTDVTRREKMYDLFERPFFEYLYTQFSVVVIYLRLLFVPVNQTVIYNIKPSRAFFEPKVIGPLIFLISIVLYAVRMWMRSQDVAEKKLFSLGIFWFFITISVESSFIPIKDLIFEHRVYLPSAGFIVSFCALLSYYLKNNLTRYTEFRKTAAVALVLGAVLTSATYIRNDIWTDEIRFWDDVVKKVPDKAIGYHNRGNSYLKIGRYDLAVLDMDKTVAFFPKTFDNKNKWENSDFTPSNMSKTYMNRGFAHQALGEFEKANADYAQAKKYIEYAPPLR